MKKYLPGGVLLLLALALYLPTLRTGFLTDDFLDCSHNLQEVPAAFLHEAGGGYRPLMVLSWAMDNAAWGITRPWGWHLTNLIILAAAVLSLRLFLRCFVKSEAAMLAGTALLLFSVPAAVSVARVSWRTTLLAMIPFLLSAVMVYRGGHSRKRGMFAAGGFLFLVSLLLKESFLAGGPVLAAVAYSSSSEKPWKNALKAFGVSLAAVLVYAALRYEAMGWNVNYTESSRFGLFMIKNILVQNAAVWKPWLTGISVRVLFLLIPVFIYFSAKEWKHRALVALSGVFLLLPVSNLPSRIDLAVAALPAAALTIAFFTERYGSSSLFRSLIPVFFAGVILTSADELKLLKAASDTLDRETIMIAGIAGDLPGDGPVFISGVTEEIGGYGTFWEGEYILPMECLGVSPGRMVTGTRFIWQILIESGKTGTLVFMDQWGGYRDYPLSRDMYRVGSDTLVSAAEPLIAGSLVDFPGCRAAGPDERLLLVSSAFPVSMVEVCPSRFDEDWFFALSAVPLWLTGDSTLILISDGDVLEFTCRNIAEEAALEILEEKRAVQVDHY